MNPSTTSTSLSTGSLRTRKFVLVDGNALLHRAYHATPPLTTSNGLLVNAVYGFTSMLLKALEDLKPDFVAVAWDKKAPTFRHVQYEQYKANRQKADDALLGQYEIVDRVLKSLDIPQFSLTGFEADDLVGTLTKLAEKEKDLETVILTGDRDMMQLISPKTKILMPKRTLSDVGMYGEAEFRLRYGFAPINMVDYKGLAGDPSDNIPGVPGIGEVTATKLIQQYATIEEVYKHLKDLPERTNKLLEKGKESAFMSKKLATLETEVLIRLDLAKCRIHEFDKEEARKVFEELEFKSLINRIPGYQKDSEELRDQKTGESEIQTNRNFDLSGSLSHSEFSAISDSESGKNEITTKLDKEVDKVLKKMTETGVLVDLNFLSKFGKQLKSKLSKVEQDLYSVVGHQFNPNSPKQLQVVLFDDLKLPVGRKTKTGRSTDETTLHELYDAHPIIPLLLQYRQLFKLVSTYIDALPKSVASDGRIHSTFNVEGAATGRISCVPLNSQILTESGWKEYGELEIGEVVLGYDIIQKRYYWTQLKNIHRGRASVGLLQITNGHSITFRKGIWCTGEHRWIVAKDQVIGFAQTKNIPRKYNTILLNHSLFPDTAESLLSPQGAFLLGWYLTDGFLTGKKNFGLGINVVKQRSIDLLETRLGDILHSKNRYRLFYDKSHYVTAFHISSKIFDPIYKIYINNTPSKLVLKLSRKSRETMMLAMLEGDGSMRRNKKEYDRFGALKIQRKATCEIFELLSVSLGMPYTAREYKLPGSKNIFIGYNLLKEELNSNKNSNWREEKIEEVWCPETECGTWVMRQGNQIVITGNSRNPNLQNIPVKGETGGEIRKAFIAPARGSLIAPTGMVLLGADYSQIELRIMAHLSHDENLIKAFEKGEDIHAATASKIFNVPLDKISKEQRMMGKTMNFATLYGQGAHSLAQQLKTDYATASAYIEEYFGQFPRVRIWKEKVLEQAREKGYTETLWGRKRYFPELKSQNRMMQSFGERAAINHPVQGCLPWETKILTSDGYIPIGEIYTAKEKPPFVWDGSEWKPYEVLDRGEAQLALIKFSNGQIFQCDVRHKVLTINEDGYEWKEYSELKPGIKVCFSMPTIHEFSSKPFHFRHIPKVHNGIPLKISLDKEFWYWLGYYIGDGCLNKRWNRAWVYALTYFFGEHESKKVEECIQFFTSLGFHPKKRKMTHRPKVRLSTRYYVTIHSQGLGKLFERLGLFGGKDAHTKQLPACIFTESLENRCAFIKGIMNSDGYEGIKENNNPSIHLYQRELLQEIQLLLRTIGVESQIRGPYIYNDKISYRLDIHRNALAQVLNQGEMSYYNRYLNRIAPQFLVQEAVFLGGHLQKSQFATVSDYVLYNRWKNGGTSSLYHFQTWLKRNKFTLPIPVYHYNEITEIKVLDKFETTYTLSVSGSHRFDSEGVISKNTAADMIKKAMVEIDKELTMENGKLKINSQLSILNCQLILQVHDELLFECDPGCVNEIAKMVKDKMENALKLNVPVIIDLKVGKNWGEMKELKA